jgi:hypothetical protein
MERWKNGRVEWWKVGNFLPRRHGEHREIDKFSMLSGPPTGGLLSFEL